MADEKDRREAAEERRAATQAEPGYIDQRWDGIPHYQCKGCPWDSFDKALMEEHQADQTQQQIHVQLARARAGR
jgi:hypothetical protein